MCVAHFPKEMGSEDPTNELYQASGEGSKCGMFLFKNDVPDLGVLCIFFGAYLSMKSALEVCDKHSCSYSLCSLDMLQYCLIRSGCFLHDAKLHNVLKLMFNFGWHNEFKISSKEQDVILGCCGGFSLSTFSKFRVDDKQHERECRTQRNFSLFPLPACAQSNLLNLIVSCFESEKDIAYLGDDRQCLLDYSHNYPCDAHRDVSPYVEEEALECVHSHYANYCVSGPTCLVCFMQHNVPLGGGVLRYDNETRRRIRLAAKVRGVSRDHLLIDLIRKGFSTPLPVRRSRLEFVADTNEYIWNTPDEDIADSFIQDFSPGLDGQYPFMNPWAYDATWDDWSDTLEVGDLRIPRFTSICRDLMRYAIQDLSLAPRLEYEYGSGDLIACARACSGFFDEKLLSMFRMWLQLYRKFQNSPCYDFVQLLQRVDPAVYRVSGLWFWKKRRLFRVTSQHASVAHIEEVDSSRRPRLFCYTASYFEFYDPPPPEVMLTQAR